MTTIADATPELFSPHVQSVFTAHFEGGSYSLTLETVDKRPRGRIPDGIRDPFSLFFTGPGPQYLMQGTYRVSHGALGEMEIFVVPLGPRGEVFRYQSAFS